MAKAKTQDDIIKRNFTFRLNVVLFYVVIIEVIAFSFQYLSLNKDFKNTIALATTVKPETFTELYFDNHTQLPSTVTENQTITFSFTVHNLEYQTYTYPYEVYLEEDGKKTEIDKGTFTLQQDGYKTITETYTLPQTIVKAKVDVNLRNKNQDVFFWINGKGTHDKTQ